MLLSDLKLHKYSTYICTIPYSDKFYMINCEFKQGPIRHRGRGANQTKQASTNCDYHTVRRQNETMRNTVRQPWHRFCHGTSRMPCWKEMRISSCSTHKHINTALLLLFAITQQITFTTTSIARTGVRLARWKDWSLESMVESDVVWWVSRHMYMGVCA